MTSFSDRLEQANVLVDKLIWIPGAVSVMGKHEDLYELISSDLYDTNDAPEIAAKLPGLKRLLCEEKPEWDEVVEALSGVEGFFIQLTRPIPTSFLGDTGYSSSWGYCQLKWAYVKTIDEIVDVAEAFSAAVVSRAKAKSCEVLA